MLDLPALDDSQKSHANLEKGPTLRLEPLDVISVIEVIPYVDHLSDGYHRK